MPIVNKIRRLTPEDQKTIIFLFNNGVTQEQKLADMYRVSTGTISKILTHYLNSKPNFNYLQKC
jgi:hypothetical protein